MPPEDPLFPPAFLRQLEVLDDAVLRLRGQGGEGLTRKGRTHGHSEFRGHRPYTIGDDLRQLDWNAYGRLGRHFMREFERERHEHITLLVDHSPSMAVAGKHVLARRFAAAMGFMALRRGGSAAVAGQPAVEGAARFARLLDQLRALEPTGPALATQLEALAARPRAPADLLVVSDGLEPLEALQPLASLSARRTAVTLLLVLAPEELLPPRGQAELAGLEEGRSLTLDLDAAHAAYLSELEKHLQSIELLARRNGWTLAVTDTRADLRELFLGKLGGAS